MEYDYTPEDGDGSPRGGGQPRKLTPEIATAIVAHIANGNYRVAACRAVGVSYTTFKRWIASGKKFPHGLYGQFCAAVAKAEGDAEARVVARLMDHGQEDPKMLAWFLERKFPQRWGKYRGELGEAKRRIAELEKQLAEILGIPHETAGQADI